MAGIKNIHLQLTIPLKNNPIKDDINVMLKNFPTALPRLFKLNLWEIYIKVSGVMAEAKIPTIKRQVNNVLNELANPERKLNSENKLKQKIKIFFMLNLLDNGP